MGRLHVYKQHMCSPFVHTLILVDFGKIGSSEWETLNYTSVCVLLLVLFEGMQFGDLLAALETYIVKKAQHSLYAFKQIINVYQYRTCTIAFILELSINGDLRA